MAKRMGRLYEGGNNKTVLPKRDRQAKIVNRLKTILNGTGDRTRENWGLPS